MSASLLWALFSCLTYGEPCEQAKWKELHEINYLGEWKGEKTGYGRFAGPPDPEGARAKAAAEEKAAAEARLAAEAEAEMRARMEAEERARAEREAAAREAAPEERDADGGLLEALYRTLSKMIYKAMIEQWDEAAADKSATDDWERDAKGGTSLDRRAFTDSLFELADTWAAEGAGDLLFGGLPDFFSGLEVRIGSPDPRVLKDMMADHCSRADAQVRGSAALAHTTRRAP